MKNYTVLFLIFLSLFSNSQDFEWVKDLAESAPDIESSDPNAFEIVDIEVDGDGYVYVLGNFKGTVDVAPGSSTLNLTSVGGIDLFLAKYDDNGNVIRVFVAANTGELSGSTNTDEIANDMVLSSDGFLYVTGSFERSFYFEGHYQEVDVELESSCSNNMYVAKISKNNFYVAWAKEPYSCYEDMDSERIVGEVITIKGTDEIFVGGHFYGAPAVVDGENFSSNDSYDDVFFAKINSDGDYQWGKEIVSDGDNQEYITGIAAGSYLYLTGHFDEDASLDLNPTSSTSYVSSNGSQDIFLAMYSASTGGFFSSTYVSNIGGSNNDYSTSIFVDQSNNVYLSGFTASASDLDIKTGTSSNNGGFIAKYSSLLTYLWHINLPTARGVAKIDADNNIVVNGRFNNTVDFNPRGEALNLSSTSSYPSTYSGYVGKYDSDGNALTISAYGGEVSIAYEVGESDPPNFGNRFLLGASGNSSDFVIYGKYKEIVDFDPGYRTELMSPATYQNGRYLAKFSHCYPTLVTTQTTGESIFCEGDNLSMYVNATGNNLTYQWNIDGDPRSDGYTAFGNIGGTETNYLTINDISYVAGGMPYNCEIISTCYDQVFSDEIDVEVNRLPQISSQPGSVTDCEGSDVTLTVGTQYATSYQWLVNSGSGSFQAIADNATYSGSQSASLQISNIQPAQSYYQYKCQVIGDCLPDLYSNPATLIVTANPNIQAHPNNTSVCEGTDAIFSVSTSGSGLDYQWQRSTDGVSFSNAIDNSFYSGSQSSTLTISGITLGFNNYQYRCIVSGTCGSDITSNAAIVTVNENAQLTSQPSDIEECEYEDVTLSVNATGYDLNYRWQVNEGSTWENLNNGGSYSNVSSPSLNISYLDPALSGNQYRCLVTSGCSANIYSDIVDLTVSQSPNIIVSSSEGTDICDGNTTDLTITGGDVSYIYQWKRNYSAMPGESSDHLSISQTGTYSLYAENSVGCSSETDPLTINVHALPNANITVLGNSEFCEGSYTELFVPSGNGYTYQWHNDMGLISGEISNAIIVTETENYYAEVTSMYGCSNASSTESITVNALPAVSLSSSDIQVCYGATETLTADYNADYLYQWKRNNLNISGENNNSIEIGETGLYNIDVINVSTGCNYTSAYVTATVNALPEPEIQVNGTLTYCVDDEVELSLAETYNDYLWTGGLSSSTLLVNSSGTYEVIVTDANGCSNTGELVVLEELVATPNICMVTVDTTINKNLIVWEHLEDNPGVASYNVYKLQTGSYQLLGNVLYNDTTQFVDQTSQPDVHSDQYAIAAVDSCGNIGAYSPFHQTMNLSIVDGSGDGIALIWTKYIDEAGINDPTEYEIYRGSSSLQYFASITGGLSDYNYNIPTVQDNERFIIVVQRPLGCAPLNNGAKASGGPYYQSVSNIEDEGIIATNIKNILANKLEIYPNPAKDWVKLSSDKTINNIKVYNILGQTILEVEAINAKTYQLNVKTISKGTYIIEINNIQKQQLIIE